MQKLYNLTIIRVIVWVQKTIQGSCSGEKIRPKCHSKKLLLFNGTPSLSIFSRRRVMLRFLDSKYFWEFLVSYGTDLRSVINQ